MRSSRFLFLTWLCLASTASFAQPPELPPTPAPREGDTVGWHVVRPGEILETITEHYLGTQDLWPENWRLNPEITDPNRLRIGQRIRVILQRKLPVRTAQLRKIERQVDQKPEPNPWIPAKVGDLLRERDGVRTHVNSSAEMLFDDESRLVISEQSVVFLREMGASLRGVNRQSIEIVNGQIELEAKPATARKRSTDIEILVGDTKARPQPDATGVAQTRARRSSPEETQLMVYGGSSTVEASGATVPVPKGMGTSVPKGKPPKPPEKLLPAPKPLGPAARSKWTYSNPKFTWEAVATAASYLVEICRDVACAQVLARAEGLKQTSWIPEAFPTGDLHWRVTARAVSGLDGYPTTPLPFSIVDLKPDHTPPAIVLAIRPPGRRLEDGKILLGASGGLALFTKDDKSGVAEVRYRWNGGAWQQARPEDLLAPPQAEGSYLLEVEAIDHLGQVSPVLSVLVESDRSKPAAPEVRTE